jgi:hypothetical protein
MTANGRDPPLVIPPNVPTYDCDEILHIEPMGDRLKFYFVGRVPATRGSRLRLRRETKVAIIYPIAKLARAIRQAEAAAVAVHLLMPEDYIGEPEGHG